MKLHVKSYIIYLEPGAYCLFDALHVPDGPKIANEFCVLDPRMIRLVELEALYSKFEFDLVSVMGQLDRHEAVLKEHSNINMNNAK